ncbi:SMP-30/gluconolactonase/LRE family protein [Croceicoccus sp. YJ47]|uniref:SMP-30/gluconolactonase/LRE family protein n=1 Tax=Croceicoccus sp. YJ47 TaxID=2798724 RepID=UPI001922D6A9|nr:SMP-30/gluconolactonase/LRE family protein [Croceicoccus sp. YJ47]QQN73713.1 SMP-30/gluconolactonase/LRE family protein [Croceicoccus sp. YJ47]
MEEHAMSESGLTVAWRAGTMLGEGPVWIEEQQVLLFVDIHGGRICLYDPGRGAGRDLPCTGRPSFIYPAGADSFVYGSNRELRLLSLTGRDERLCDLTVPEDTRTNDGAVDVHGRLWFGMSHVPETEPLGGLFVYDRGEVRQHLDNIVVPNGPAISPDGSTMYHVDSPRGRISRYRIEDGAPVDGHLHVQIAEGDGFPDGVTLDAEGCLWVCLWDGWGVRRYDPDGRLMREIRFPCARVTKLALGGADGTTAYVTTARTGLGDAELREQPGAGSLFAFDAGVAGVPAAHCALP